jgi:uncharacterized membrane protein YbhN (UPF0104 family)
VTDTDRSDAVTAAIEVPAASTLRTWRARVFVTASDQRLRLPRDLVSAVTGAAVAVISWVGVAAGVNSPVTVTIPTRISWLVTGVAVCGTSAFIATALALCILGRRWALMGHGIVAACGAGLATWGVADLLGHGTPAAPPLIAATFATAFLVIRILGVPLRAPLWVVVYLGTVASVFDAHLVPMGAAGAAALGVTAGATVAFGFGTLDVAPTVAEAAGFLNQLGVTVTGLRRVDTVATWGATRFAGSSPTGAVLDIDVYGRDAPEGQLLARTWRFMWIRRSTLDLRLRRVDHIEHSAGLMLWARAQGVGTPTVVRAGRVEPTDDAVLVTERPAGRRLAELGAAEVQAVDLAAMWAALDRLAGAGLALNKINADTIVVDDDHRVAFLEFASAEAMAPVEARARDAASLLVTTATLVGPERAVAAAIDALGPDRVEDLLPLIQPQATSVSGLPHGSRTNKAFAELRLSAATALGIDPVEPRPLARFQLSQVLMVAGTFLALWLLVSQLIGLSGISELLVNSIWWWVFATLLITQATSLTEAVSMSGTVPVAPPIGPLTLLRFAMNFTGMIGGTVATTATVIRFNQRRGLPPGVALSSGLIYSIAGFIVQIALTLSALIFAVDEFHRQAAGASGSGPENLQLILYGVVAVSLIVGIAFVVPKIRRVIVSRLAPQFASAWDNVRLIAQTPTKLVRLFGGAAATQLMMALGLGFACYAVGTSAPFGGLVIVCTLTALLGGMAPVPGGIGVMEACYISGLTLLGVHQELAIAETIIYRACTTYLPPLWGWGALVWLRRHDAL